MRRRAEWHNDQMARNVRGSFGTAEEEGLDLSMWWTPSAMWKLESYTDSSGYFMQFPFDTLHTVSAGLGLAERIVMEDAGHWLQFEKAPEFNPLLESFLQRPVAVQGVPHGD